MFELTNYAVVLNRSESKILEKSVFSMSPMSESEILTIFQTSPIFLEKLVRAVPKRFLPSFYACMR